MELQGTLIWLCSLAALSSSVNPVSNCSSPTELMGNLFALKVAVECGEKPMSSWTTQETATVLLSMRNLTDTLHKQQLKACKVIEPKDCPEAEVPVNGGLACFTVDNKRYCKPLCNHGYDFAFLRRSRLYDECNEQSGYRWQTQYVGGNRLAECNEAPFAVSGDTTAYFPKDEDCLTTQSSNELHSRILEVFATELKSKGIEGEPQYGCLVCG